MGREDDTVVKVTICDRAFINLLGTGSTHVEGICHTNRNQLEKDSNHYTGLHRRVPIFFTALTEAIVEHFITHEFWRYERGRPDGRMERGTWNESTLSMNVIFRLLEP